MQAQAHAEPLPEDYLAWQDDYAEKKPSAIHALKRNPRALAAGAAGLTALLLVVYYATSSSSATTSPSSTSPAIEKTALPMTRSPNDLDALRAAFSEQNATNQQIVAAIDALRAEQHELRKQITALQTARQSAGITGSIGTTGSISPRPQPKPLPAKKPEQADARPVPYPAQVPYPRPN